MVTRPGRCCPECVPKPCSVSGRVYQGENKVQRPGKCCEECVSSKGSCLYDGAIRYHSEMWNSTRCDFCLCDEGQVTCQKAECARVECAKGEELIHLDGKCCPECISSNSHCVYKEHTKANGEKWEEGPCGECECRDAEVTCFQRSCPPCPLGSLAVEAQGDCCPRCEPVECHPDCLTCSQSFDHCTACRDARRQLQNGRCVEMCELGFYQDGGSCLACNETCSACTSGFECSSCQTSLLMKNGQCVTWCGKGYFQDQLRCTACHESCSSCWGAAENNCLSCKDTSRVLKAGLCVASCGQGFYTKDGICSACDQFCETCYSDPPRCLTCASEKLLHDGKCVSECPDGYFPGINGRCRACHDSCSTCEGPLATHCTSCSFPLALHRGQCLRGCGEGFYQDHNVCKGCHPSCRTCVGPGASHCLQCRAPQDVLQPHQPVEGAVRGLCLSRCQARFYVDSTGVCKRCHSSCAGCLGNTSQDCTACLSSRVLLEGRCLSECPEGLFSRGDHCYSCHPSCKTCRGPSDLECLTCHPHATLASGKCRTSCKEEQYLNLVGYCVDCHPLCRQCVANLWDTGSICLKCQNARHLLLGDHCIPDCLLGYYAENGACKRCHPSCKTCTGEGPFSCSSCNTSLVLSHTSTCVAVCSPGYYRDDRQTCKPCNRQCLSCESAAGCTSCRDPAKVLLFGECQYESCAQQYYLDFSSKTCRECDWSCNACKGPQRTDCLQCMEGYVLHEGACVEQCPAAFYKESDTCQRCDQHCLQCRQPDECSLCEAPFFLLDTRCVHQCGKRYYADHAQRKCSACPPGCLECDSDSMCHLCDSTTFLQDKICVSACGQGFYGNTWTRECEEASKHPSSFHVNSTLTVGIGGVKPLDLPLLGVRDLDGDTGQLLFRIDSTPSNGRLVMVENGKEEQLSKGDHFSCEDVKEKRVRFVHSKEKSRKGQFTLKVSDQQFSHPEVVNIQAFSTQAPYVFRNEALLVHQGKTGTITELLLGVRDSDNPQDVALMVLEPPRHGRLIKPPGDSASAVHVFQLDDLANGLLRYAHDGSDTRNDVPPKMVLEPVRVHEGSGVVVTNTSLNLQDLDSQNSELVIVVTKSPEYGHLRRRQTAAEPPERGHVLSVGSSFTYQDILDELIIYTQSGAAAQTDEFGFSITDGLYTQTGRLEFSMEQPKKQPPTLAVNRDLQLPAGSTAHLTDQHLKAAAVYSDDTAIRFVMKRDPSVGHLQLTKTDNPVRISVKGPVKSFTQADINKGQVAYSHKKGDPGGDFAFIFDVIDADGNKLTDQVFYISVLENRFPPSIIANKGLVLDENSAKTITTLQLSAADQDSEPAQLQYKLTKQPQLGHLEHVASPGRRIGSFSQADLASRSIQYVHTSDVEKHTDAFTFSVSDGANEVSQTFDITINPVDDSLPVVRSLGMTVQEGVRKTITEFELQATDADTEAESITFTVMQPPRHGLIERTSNGQRYHQATTFTMDDIYQNRISYSHDGSNSLKDRFTFTVSDGTNPFFVVEDGGRKVVTTAPQRFKVDVLSVDDGTPRVVTNLGLQWLEYVDGKAANLITKKELLTADPDTDDKQLIYEITTGPRNGYVENKLKPGTTVTTFTQEDVNQGLIRYVMHEEKIQETMDSFQFLVKDSKPNVVSGNIFHVQWSLLSFTYTSYSVRESAGSVSVTVRRIGNLNQYAIVLCRTEQGTATSSSGSQPGEQDYVEYAGQVQFEEREDTKACTIVINDDNVFESMESFAVELSMPAYALLGNVTRATVTITDPEDEPTLQFDRKTYHVSESAGFFSAPVERKGDTSSTVSAICYTVPRSAKGSSLHMLESGSDFKSRGMADDSRIVFGPGVTVMTCDVTLIDDSEYEEEEEFEIVLADASDNARVGSRASANVFIGGPNDASTVSLGNATFAVSEAAGNIEIPVLRQGPDLSTPVSVWCATRTSDPPSASPGIDYVPSSRKIEFRPGKTEEFCTLTILDDAQYPVIEGLETFVVYLSSPHGAELTKPFQAVVAINDIFQDVPSMQFTKDTYTVKEKEGTLHIPIFRTGDLSYESSVRCYTQSQTAEVTEDFAERRNAEESRITFSRGEKVKNCSVSISDDSAFEPEEQFQVYLGSPLGNHWSGARIGKTDVATITVTNDEDAPTVEFEEAAYQVREPPGPEGVAVINIKVVRRGDQNRTSKVRCSTRDGSAQAGVDYYPKSRMLKFSPGVNHVMFKVEIMSNEDREWHESFSLVLGPDDPVEAVLGDTSTAIVTILDQEAAGSLILPAPPVVVTLADYDRVEEVTKAGAKKSPSPGYPLICVTPCDPHFPKYAVTKERCGEAGINQSSIQFSWEVATPTDGNGARSPFETITDNTPFTSVTHKVLDSIYFSRRFHVRCVAKAVDKAGRVGTPLRSNVVTIGTDGAICHTPVVAGTARGFQAQSFVATLKYLDVKHKEHPNRIHISVQIPHQDGMLPLISTLPLHNLHFLLSESIYRHQHVCSNLVTVRDLRGISEAGFLDEVTYDSIALGPGYDRPYQFDPGVREAKTIRLYKHLNLKSCIWTFDAYYDMTELIDVCGGSVTADFQVRDSAQSFLTVHVPLYVSYIYVTAPRGWASLEHHTEMEFSFFYDTVLWRTGIQTESVLSARLQIIRIYIREDGRLVIEFKTQAKFRGLFVMEHHSLPDVESFLLPPEHLGGIGFELQLLWSAQTFDSPHQLWRATSSYNRKDYSGEYTIFLIPCTVQPTQPWAEPGDKPLPCTAHAPERFLIPIAFQQTNRPVPVVYSLNTEFQLCNNEKVFLMDPTKSEMSLAEMDYKGAFSKGQILYGRVLWNPDQNLNAAYKLQLEKVYLCTGKDGYVPFFDPTGTVYNEGPQYGCIQPNKHLKHRFLLLDRNQPEGTDKYFHDVPFDAHFASELSEFHSVSSMPGVDGFTLKVDALYKVEAGHQWYLQVIYVIGPESMAGPRVARSLGRRQSRGRRDLVASGGRLLLAESLMYDNEGAQLKNGTNMKWLSLEREEGAVAASFSPTGASLGSAIAAVALLLLALSGVCLLPGRCGTRRRTREAARAAPEEHPLETEVAVPRGAGRAPDRRYCTVRDVTVLRGAGGACQGRGGKVKQVTTEVKAHSNLHDGTEV
ncbi:extracellular matrix organizing protein FRAS1 isoform 2-T2 [Pluvialis apricaria]